MAVTKQPKLWLPVGVVTAGVGLVLAVSPIAMATTGAEDAFGAAGIGLLVLGLGAAVVTGARFLSRRRES